MLGRLCHRIDAAARVPDRHQRRRRGEIAIPDVVPDRLEVPHAPARRRIEGQQRVRVEVVAEPIGAIEVGRRRAGRDVDQSTHGVHRHPRPVVRGPAVGPGVLRPGLVARFTRMRDGVKRPAERAGSHVIGADVAGRRGQALGRAAADDIERLVDDAGAREGDALLIRIAAEIGVEIDAPVAPEAGDRQPGRSIEGVDVAAEAGQDPAIAAVGPVGHAAAGAACP